MIMKRVLRASFKEKASVAVLNEDININSNAITPNILRNLVNTNYQAIFC